MERVTFCGSLASIAGLCLTFYSGSSVSQGTPNNSSSTLGSHSPAIAGPQGDVNISYGNSTPTEKTYVIRHPDGGAALIVSEPSIDSVMDPEKHICMAIAGTPIQLLDETSQLGGMVMWQKIEIVKGACTGKVGWSSVENISYE